MNNRDPGEPARAEQRRLDWLSIELRDAREAHVGADLEHAKTELAKVTSASLLRTGDILAMARAAPPSDATRFILQLADSILGIEADAERGRLVLRPRLPDEWRDVVVKNIRIGDASITMRYDATGDMRRFTLTQTGGAYPIRLIFEPAMMPPIKFVFVDSVLATLDLRNVDGRIVTPVQIMLDDTRVVEFQSE